MGEGASGFCWWPRSPLLGDRPEVCGVCCAGRATCPPGKWVSSPVWPHFVIEELGAMRFLEMGTALGKRLPSCPVPVLPAPLPASVCPQPPWAGHAAPSSSLSHYWSVGGSGGCRSLERSGHSAFDLSLPGKSPISPTVASLPANIFPGVVTPGGVGGPHQAGDGAELC